MVGLCAIALWNTASRSGQAAVMRAADPGAVAIDGSVRLQTLNVFGLPWPLAPKVDDRCQRIAAAVAAEAVDLVALQEAWGEDACAPFAQPQLHRACCCSPAGLVGSTGLLTVSRYPIAHAESRYFAAEEGIEALVQKGVLRTVIELPDQPLEVWNLHLQSGIDDTAVRLAQINQLLSWLATVEPTTRVAVVGDFNCAPGDREFARLQRGLAKLGFVRAACGQPTYDADSNPLAMKEAPREIDHIFVRGFANRQRGVRVYDEPLGGMYPSDHYGVEVTLALGNCSDDGYESHK